MGFIVLVSLDEIDLCRRGFDCVNQWQAHAGTVLSSTIGGNRLITGGNDCYLAIWDISACVPAPQVEETSMHCVALLHADVKIFSSVLCQSW